MYNIKIFLNYNKNALSRVVHWLNLNFTLTKVWYKLGYESINWKFTVFKWIFMTDNTTGTPYLPFKTMSPHINQPKIDFWSSHVTSSYYHVTSSRGFVWLYSIKATMHHFLVNTRVKTACKNWLQTVCCWRLEQMSKLENQNFYFLPNRKFFLGHAQNPTSESVSKCIQGPINVYNASDQRGSSLKMFPVLTRPEILRTCAFLIYSRRIISRVLSPGVTRWCLWDGIIYCYMSSRDI